MNILTYFIQLQIEVADTLMALHNIWFLFNLLL